MTRIEFTIYASESGQRLDSILGARPELGSRSRGADLVGRGAVLVDGVRRTKSYVVGEGQSVVVTLPDEGPPDLIPEVMDVAVLFEDDWLLVVDKPAGMPVHPSPGHLSGTLVNALLGHGLAGGETYRPGIVHRLDKDTSGLLVVAKDAGVHRRLVALLRDKGVERQYLTLVHGGITAERGTIEAPVGRDRVRRKTMTIGGGAAREARTHFRVLERFREFTLLEVHLDTGRTHQIRVHLRGIGHPVAGDATYGRRDILGVGRQFLHSARLAFVHPVTDERLDLQSRLPPDLTAVLDRVRAGESG